VKFKGEFEELNQAIVQNLVAVLVAGHEDTGPAVAVVPAGQGESSHSVSAGTDESLAGKTSSQQSGGV
jgi:hypothetical protein